MPAVYWFKIDGQWLEREERDIASWICEVVRPGIAVCIPACLLKVQDSFQLRLRLFLEWHKLFWKLAQFFYHPHIQSPSGSLRKPLKVQQLKNASVLNK